jgi:hypothetical protein
LQSDIAQAIAGEVRVKLRSQEQWCLIMTGQRSVEPDAYEPTSRAAIPGTKDVERD